MRYTTYALVMILMFGAGAIAEEVRFNATWQHPTLADGTKEKVEQYVLYACDVPMSGGFGGVLSDEDLIGKCDGNLMSYLVPGDRTSYEGVYTAQKKKGEVFFRMTSRRIFQGESGVEYVESDLSEQAAFKFFVKPGKPRGVTVEEVK